MKRIPVIILGAGGVGRALIEQLVAARELHAARMGGRFDVVAVADSRSWRWAPQGLDDDALLQLVAAKNKTRRSSPAGRGKQRPPAPLFGEEHPGNEAIVQQAVEAGAAEAWQVDPDGTVTEGSSTNAWIITAENKLVTRKADHSILNGITRMSLIAAAQAAGLDFEERPFTVEEARQAREAFLTSSTNLVMPVVRIDDQAIGNGHPGMLTIKLRQLYLDYVTAAPAKASARASARASGGVAAA